MPKLSGQIEKNLAWLQNDIDAYHDKLRKAVDNTIADLTSKAQAKDKARIIDKGAMKLGFTIKD